MTAHPVTVGAREQKRLRSHRDDGRIMIGDKDSGQLQTRLVDHVRTGRGRPIPARIVTTAPPGRLVLPGGAALSGSSGGTWSGRGTWALVFTG